MNHGTLDYISNGRVIQLPRGELIGCGCCRGPKDDRCCCWMHQDVPRGLKAHKCSIHRTTERATRSQPGAHVPEHDNGNEHLFSEATR